MEGGLSAADKAVLTLDITGIFDPTPFSDTFSGLISLLRGEWTSAALSAASLIPYIGDAAGKPAKLAKIIRNGFPHLAEHLARPQFLENTLANLRKLSPARYEGTLVVMNSMRRDAADFYVKNAGAGLRKTVQKLRLPTNGPIVFVPPKGFDGVKRNGGYRDAYGYLWKWAPKPNGKGEWDVRLKGGKGGFDYFAKDARHANISPEGRVTH